MQRSALCRSRRELSNAYFLAKFGFDTAENYQPASQPRTTLRKGPKKVCSKGPRWCRLARRRCTSCGRGRGWWSGPRAGASSGSHSPAACASSRARRSAATSWAGSDGSSRKRPPRKAGLRPSLNSDILLREKVARKIPCKPRGAGCLFFKGFGLEFSLFAAK